MCKLGCELSVCLGGDTQETYLSACPLLNKPYLPRYIIHQPSLHFDEDTHERYLHWGVFQPAHPPYLLVNPLDESDAGIQNVLSLFSMVVRSMYYVCHTPRIVSSLFLVGEEAQLLERHPPS